MDPSRSQTTFGDAPLRSRPLAAQCRITDEPSKAAVSVGFMANCGTDPPSFSAETNVHKLHARASQTFRLIWAKIF